MGCVMETGDRCSLWGSPEGLLSPCGILAFTIPLASLSPCQSLEMFSVLALRSSIITLNLDTRVT